MVPLPPPPPEARLLVIDDEEDAFFLTKRLLRRAGATETIEWCDNGERGLSRLLELAREGAPPVLVTLDLRMPGMDGHSVLAALKADPRLRRVLVVVISSSGLPEDAARAISLGAYCYFEKYPTAEELAAVYAIARESAPAPAPVHPAGDALRKIIGLVEEALTVSYVHCAHHTSPDRELMNRLAAIRRRASERLLDCMGSMPPHAAADPN